MSGQNAAESCIFCRIIRGEIPSTKVYENEHVLAFLDINPIAPGHTLVIPKAHCETLVDMPEQAGPHVIAALAKIGKAAMEAAEADGFNCLQNNFAAAGQEVFHSHWHIIPRFEGDGLKHWPHKTRIDAESMLRIAESMSAKLG